MNISKTLQASASSFIVLNLAEKAVLDLLTLQASGFSFIVLNLAEKAVFDFFLIMLNYTMSAQRKKQLQLPTQSTLKKNHRNTKNISFQFHYGKKLVNKSNLQGLIVTAV